MPSDKREPYQRDKQARVSHAGVHEHLIGYITRVQCGDNGLPQSAREPGFLEWAHRSRAAGNVHAFLKSSGTLLLGPMAFGFAEQYLGGTGIRPRRSRAELTRVVVEEPRAGGFWRGAQGSTWWFYFTGDCSDLTWDAYIEHCRNMLHNCSNGALICIAHRADSPSGTQRKRLIAMLEAEAARLPTVRGFALVVDSPLQVFALKTINWVVKSKPFDEGVFGAPSAGARWLSERTNVPAQELLSAIAHEVPQEYLWLD